MPAQTGVNLKGDAPHSLCHFTWARVLPHHLSLLLTHTSELRLLTEGRQTPSAEPNKELEDGAASFKTGAFLQKKELFEALI